MVDGVTVDEHGLAIEYATLNGVDFSGRKESEWTVVESRLVGCRFDGLRVKKFGFGSGAATSEYIECVFDNSHIRSLLPGNARFVRCSFRNTRLTRWICNMAEFIDCEFHGSVLRQINFNAEPPGDLGVSVGRVRNRYEGNDFSGAELDGVAFLNGIDLRRQRLPSGEDYIFVDDAKEVLSVALRSVAAWPESVTKDTIVFGLEFYRDYTYHHQRQLLISRHFFAKKGDDGKQVFAALRDVIDVARGAVKQVENAE